MRVGIRSAFVRHAAAAAVVLGGLAAARTASASCRDNPSEAACTGRSPAAEGCDLDSEVRGTADLIEHKPDGSQVKIGNTELRYSPTCRSFWGVTRTLPESGQVPSVASVLAFRRDNTIAGYFPTPGNGTREVVTAMAFLTDGGVYAQGAVVFPDLRIAFGRTPVVWVP